MPREVKVSLGGTDYVVKALNIAQLEEMADLISGPITQTVGIKILMLALKRATPQLSEINMEEFAPELPEIATAVEAILALSGLKKPEDPPKAA